MIGQAWAAHEPSLLSFTQESELTVAKVLAGSEDGACARDEPVNPRFMV